MTFSILLMAASVAAQPTNAQSVLEAGLGGALRGCEEWVLNPSSWVDGTGPFIASTGLGNKIGLVDRVDVANLPPENLRAGNHYWRINSTAGAGYVLVTSDIVPMCHLTGGGNADLQPIVEAVLATPGFVKRWEAMDSFSRSGMASTQFRNRANPAFSMIVSRAEQPGGPTDRVQVIVTATYNLQK